MRESLLTDNFPDFHLPMEQNRPGLLQYSKTFCLSGYRKSTLIDCFKSEYPPSQSFYAVISSPKSFYNFDLLSGIFTSMIMAQKGDSVFAGKATNDTFFSFRSSSLKNSLGVFPILFIPSMNASNIFLNALKLLCSGQNCNIP